jgi:hypothetical protein
MMLRDTALAYHVASWTSALLLLLAVSLARQRSRQVESLES